jgi:hypothetical protein
VQVIAMRRPTPATPRRPARLRTAVCSALAGLAALAGCGQLEVKQDILDTAESVRKGPERAPFRSITTFADSLRCMDNLLVTYGVRDVSVLAEELADATKKVNAGTRDMLISAVSDMTRRSRAIRLVAFGQDAGNLISFLAQAERKSAYSVIPQFDIKGSISQFDENVARKDASFGAAFGEYFNLGTARTGSATIIAIDLTVLNTADMSVLPGVTSRNAALVQKSGRGLDGDAQYRKFGINYTTSLARAEGNTQALRNLVELAAIELFGKLVKVPYWTCLGADGAGEEVKREINDWYFSMTGDAAELIAWFQQQLATRNLYQGPVDGEGNAALGQAISRYRQVLGLPEGTRIDQALFSAYLNADHAALAKQLADVKPFVHEAPPQTAQAGTPGAPGQPPASGSTGTAPVAAKPEPVRLAIAPARADGRFKRGEALELAVRADRDAYVYCFLRDDNNAIQRFFPNRFTRDALVRAGQPLAIPGRMRFQLHASEKGIAETVACFGAPKDVFAALPAALKASDFESLARLSLEDVRAAFAQTAGSELGVATFVIDPR